MKIQKRPMKAESMLDEENSLKQRKTTIDVGHSLAWDIIIPKLDFQSQMKISQLNHHLADVVESTSNAEYELQKYKRHIREDKYIARKFSNRKNWAFYRALIWIFEEQDAIQTRSKKKIHSPIATLAKAEFQVKKMWCDELNFHYNLQIMYYEQNPRSIDIELIQVGNTDWRLELDRKNSTKDSDLIFC